jgi:hypothetical protein
MFKMPGKVVITNPINQLEHPRWFNLSGSIEGTTADIKVKQKSPQSNHPKTANKPIFV